MHYLDFAINLAKEAGDIMRANFTLGMKKEWKEDNSPLTLTDTTINELVIQKVKERFPDHAVLGEEDNLDTPGATHLWVVDPVDGTIPFSHGVPTFVFSLALVVNGESQVGVVYDPMLDRLLAAEKGKGATFNGKPTYVSRHESLHRTVMNIDGPWKDGNSATDFTLVPAKIREQGVKLTRFSCLAYGGMLVALGEYPAALGNGGYPWDIAALKVIIEEAGGKVTNLIGEDQLYNRSIYGAILSNGKVHDQIVDILRPFCK